MEVDKDILNHAMGLSMEFGENWLMDFKERLKDKFPEITNTQLKHCDALMRKANKFAHDFVRKYPVKNGNEISFISYSEFESHILDKYQWIDKENLNTLYSQSCYYALK